MQCMEAADCDAALHDIYRRHAEAEAKKQRKK
jgi:hypothetical protein